jgi:hypothetical protein
MAIGTVSLQGERLTVPINPSIARGGITFISKNEAFDSSILWMLRGSMMTFTGKVTLAFTFSTGSLPEVPLLGAGVGKHEHLVKRSTYTYPIMQVSLGVRY